MSPTLLGAPLALYIFPCFLLALIWVFIWPHKIAPERGPRRAILRWGHAAVWALLGLAAAVGGSGGPMAARLLALTAVAIYVVFVATLLTTRQVEGV